MPNDALLQVRIDAKTKSRAAKLFKRFGLSTSDGIRLLLTQAIRAKEIPHIPNAATRRALAADVEPVTDDDLTESWGGE